MSRISPGPGDPGSSVSGLVQVPELRVRVPVRPRRRGGGAQKSAGGNVPFNRHGLNEGFGLPRSTGDLVRFNGTAPSASAAGEAVGQIRSCEKTQCRRLSEGFRGGGAGPASPWRPCVVSGPARSAALSQGVPGALRRAGAPWRLRLQGRFGGYRALP